MTYVEPTLSGVAVLPSDSDWREKNRLARGVRRRQEIASRVGTSVIHGTFAAFILLIVASSAKQEPQGMPVELWSDLPPAAPAVTPAVPAKPVPTPRAEPKPRPKAVSKAVPATPKSEPQPAIPKPDIAFKEDKLKKEQEAKNEREHEKRKEEEARERERLEASQKETANRLEAARLSQAAEAQQAADVKEQAALDGLIDKYSRLIRDKVRRNMVEPPNLESNPQAVFEVNLLPSGEATSVKLVQSSGNPAYDEAAERAIRKASPFELPPNPRLAQAFRPFKLRIRPRE